MTDGTEKIRLFQLTEHGSREVDDCIAIELPLTIILNSREVATLLCSPIALEQLAIGFLFSEGRLKDKDDIKQVTVDEGRGVVRVDTKEDNPQNEYLFNRLITSGCGANASFYRATDALGMRPVEADSRVSPRQISDLTREFQHRSRLFRDTGGVHSAALCKDNSMIILSEDIGRHNAVDRAFGEYLLSNISLDDIIVITSGRVSSEILLKVARRNIAILVSRSAPTSLGVKLARELGITLIGFARGGRMNVYSHKQRIADEEVSAESQNKRTGGYQ